MSVGHSYCRTILHDSREQGEETMEKEMNGWRRRKKKEEGEEEEEEIIFTE